MCQSPNPHVICVGDFVTQYFTAAPNRAFSSYFEANSFLDLRGVNNSTLVNMTRRLISLYHGANNTNVDDAVIMMITVASLVKNTSVKNYLYFMLIALYITQRTRFGIRQMHVILQEKPIISICSPRLSRVCKQCCWVTLVNMRSIFIDLTDSGSRPV
jgi:hypothetical protein